jgi:hypothetical protein
VDPGLNPAHVLDFGVAGSAAVEDPARPRIDLGRHHVNGSSAGPFGARYGNCTDRSQEGSMSTQMMWLLTAVVAIAAIAVFVLLRRKRTEQLRRRFGPEYERTVREAGDVRKAEAALQAREARVERLHIRALSTEDATRFSDAWRRVQTQFVVHARGYPVGDFDQRVEDISVDHPNVVMNYRAARDIARDHARGRASTEDLRQAMVHYRALFTELLGTTPAPDAQYASPPVIAERSRR